MKIILFKKTEKQNLKEINDLLIQLSPEKSKMSFTYFKKLLSDNRVFLAVIIDKKRIVGMGTLISAMSVANTFGLIEDVVIDGGYQGQGLGRKIVEFLIKEGQRQKLSTLKLTSKKDRVVANILYKKLGFELKETNVYRMKIKLD
jgi:phosphinothricin acetyltransferase